MQNLKTLSEGKHCQLFILPGNYRGGAHTEIYHQTYLCWKEVWEAVYQQEMKVNHQFYADDFLRQDQVISLFNRGQCVGMAFVRMINLSLMPVSQDSFFRFWPKAETDKVLSLTPDIFIASYFTVHPAFRKNEDLCWKTLLLSLFLDNFMRSDSQVMITAARKVRSNEKLCFKLGAKPLSLNVPYLLDGQKINNEIADLIYWDKTPIILEDQSLNSLRKTLWNKRIEIDQQIITQEVKDAA